MAVAARAAPNLVVSASRRTELLGHYPEHLAERVLALGPGRVHTVVVWTKDVRNLLGHEGVRAALRGVGQVFLHWTITGLGGTFLEPKAPSPWEQAALVEEAVAAVGDPRRLHWRYDPLISAASGGERATNLDLELFGALAARFGRAGVPVVRTSFATIYPKVARRLAAAGVQAEEFAAEARREFLGRLREAAGRWGLELITCCEPGFPIGRCIDGELLSALHPTGEPCRRDRARGQRELCGCTHSLDIGRYLPCPNGCLYCYAHPAREGSAGRAQ